MAFYLERDHAAALASDAVWTLGRSLETMARALGTPIRSELIIVS